LFSQAFSYFNVNINFIAILVLLVLSGYFISVFWIFLYKYKILAKWTVQEKKSLDSLIMGSNSPLKSSSLYSCFTETPSRSMLDACKQKAQVRSTIGLTPISIVATTSPFIGLFGTVLSILEAFAGFGTKTGSASLNVIAPAISEALIATAAGIFVAIFAYTFHQVLKRKSFELMSVIEISQDLILSK